MWLATAVYVAVFSYLMLKRHAGFGTQAFDLGIFDQGLWLLSRFKNPFVTLRGLNLFADHASYIMFPLAPLYWVWPDVRALIIVTNLALAAGAPLVFRIAKGEGLGDYMALALAVAYLLHPATGWNAWDSFHPEIFALPLILGSYLAARSGRHAMATVLLITILLVKEDAFLVVLPLAWILAWRFKAPRIAGWAFIAAGLVTWLSFSVVLPGLSPTGELLYGGRYARFGGSLDEVIRSVLLRPGEVAAEMATARSVSYLAAMVLPLFLSLAAPEFLLVGVPITLANLLSGHTYQAEIRYHYTVYLLALVALATCIGAGRLARDRYLPGWLLGWVIGAAVFANLAVGPWPSPDRGDPWVRDPNPDVIQAQIERVPHDAVVSVDWLIAPHMAHRERIYVFENPFEAANWGAPGEEPPPADDVEWVIAHTSIVTGDEERGTVRVFSALLEDPAWELVYGDESVMVLRRVSSD
ncbi:MAG: DUF2079 domain-containing protein [Acidimicrobiia bacterium]